MKSTAKQPKTYLNIFLLLIPLCI